MNYFDITDKEINEFIVNSGIDISSVQPDEDNSGLFSKILQFIKGSSSKTDSNINMLLHHNINHKYKEFFSLYLFLTKKDALSSSRNNVEFNKYSSKYIDVIGDPDIPMMLDDIEYTNILERAKSLYNLSDASYSILTEENNDEQLDLVKTEVIKKKLILLAELVDYLQEANDELELIKEENSTEFVAEELANKVISRILDL